MIKDPFLLTLERIAHEVVGASGRVKGGGAPLQGWQFRAANVILLQGCPYIFGPGRQYPLLPPPLVGASFLLHHLSSLLHYVTYPIPYNRKIECVIESNIFNDASYTFLLKKCIV